jgi:hypothetical protein
MARPTDDMVLGAKAVLRAACESSRHAELLESLGAYFPDSPDLAWLADGDPTFAEVFTSGEGGWLGERQDAELWSLTSEADPGAEGWHPPDALATWLEELLDSWQSGAEVGDDVTDEAGDDLAQEAVEARFVSVEPVPGPHYPGWWQGFDSVERAWKYVHTGEVAPTDDTPGWTGTLATSALEQEVAAAAPYDEPPAGPDEESPELEQALVDAVTATIEDVRALGVTEEEMSDDDIIAALQEEIAAELTG